MLRHVTITASGFGASLAFYDAALGALGLDRLAEFGDEEEADPATEAAAWGSDVPVVWLVSGARPTLGAHLALAAPDRAAVDRFHAAAIGAGGTDRHAPRRWTLYRRGTYHAIVADPDGNLVEAVSSE